MTLSDCERLPCVGGFSWIRDVYFFGGGDRGGGLEVILNGLRGGGLIGACDCLSSLWSFVLVSMLLLVWRALSRGFVVVLGE